MLTFITELPTDRPINGVHCIPVLDNGTMMMVWDKEEHVLSTIGGRLEPGESIQEALEREAYEEAGIELAEERILFACWQWPQFNAYRLYYLTKVKRFVERPLESETTGYVIMNFQTALEMIAKIEGRPERIAVVRRAAVLAGALADGV